MSNRRLGTQFESELCDRLSEKGFWAHNFTQNQYGQPADIIAVRNQMAFLIDAKLCSTEKGFDLSRMEDNQNLSMNLWEECGNGWAWFAVKFENDVYMVPYYILKRLREQQSIISISDLKAYAIDFERWVSQCE